MLNRQCTFTFQIELSKAQYNTDVRIRTMQVDDLRSLILHGYNGCVCEAYKETMK